MNTATPLRLHRYAALHEDQEGAVVDAMAEKPVQAGDVIIRCESSPLCGSFSQ